jgi:glutathione S-transferase
MSTKELVLCELGETGIAGVESFSPFCLKTHRALKAAGLPYTRRHGSRPAAFRNYNRAEQVPVLLVDGEPVADSTEILRRIVALRPGALAAEPEAWLWEELADTALYGFIVAARWADDANWPLTRKAYFAKLPPVIRAIVPGRLRKRVVGTLVARDVWRAGPERCWARFEALLDQLEARAPERGWWCGGALSVADVALFGQLHSLRTPLTASQGASLARRIRLSAWLDRVHEETKCAAPIDSSASSSYSAAAS